MNPKISEDQLVFNHVLISLVSYFHHAYDFHHAYGQDDSLNKLCKMRSELEVFPIRWFPRVSKLRRGCQC